MTLAFGVAVVWGLNFIAIHDGLESFPPLFFASLRFVLVAIPAVFFIRRPAVSWRDILAVGIFLSTLQFGFLFVSLHEGMPPGLASLVVQLSAVFTVVLAIVFLGERPERRQLAGAAVAVAGIVVIALDRTGAALPLGPLLLCIAGSACWGIGNIMVRVARAPDALALMVWSSLVAPLPLFALSLAIEGPHRIGHGLAHASLTSIGGLLFVVIGASGFGYTTWLWLIRRHPASKVAPFSLLVPVIGIAAAWIALSERPGSGEIIGGVLVLLGLGLVTAALGGRRTATAGAPAPETA